MFETDYTWGCTAGPGFGCLDFMVDGVAIRTSIGICMDLNPWEFRAPFNSFEYANYILENDITLTLIPMAWLLRRSTDNDADDEDEDDDHPSHATLHYWIGRLQPLISSDKYRTVIICNRTGHEGGAVYAGTSSVLRFGRGEVSILGLLGRQEGILTVNLEL